MFCPSLRYTIALSVCLSGLCAGLLAIQKSDASAPAPSSIPAAVKVSVTPPVAIPAMHYMVDTGKVVGKINPHIYGYLLEHIFHSINNGLWGQMVWNRSFEAALPRGNWSTDGKIITEPDGYARRILTIGRGQHWTNYAFSLEVRRTAGTGPLLILFRSSGNGARAYSIALGDRHNTAAVFRTGYAAWGPWTKFNTSRVLKMPHPAITDGRWYKIRIVCQGRHLAAFVNNHNILYIRTHQHPLRHGAVGIGALNAVAAFRDLRVISAHGRVLFTGIPSGLNTIGMAPWWQPVGNATFHWTHHKPLNGQWCQSIHLHGSVAGVRQGGFCIKADREYVGSVWLRSVHPMAATVQLVSTGRAGQTLLATAALGNTTSTWHSYAFTLQAAATDHSAALQILLRGTGNAWIDQADMTPRAARKYAGCTPDLYRAVAALHPTLFRWPGGSFASGYHWMDGIGPQHLRQNAGYGWGDQDPNAFGTDEFLNLCRHLGAQADIVINIHAFPSRTKTIKYAVQWLDYCNAPANSRWGGLRAKNGHPAPYHVKYWELDNEQWGMGPVKYAHAVRQFSVALRKADPHIRIIACGSGDFDQSWNKVLVQDAAPYMNYLSVHHYESLGNYATGAAHYRHFLLKTGRIIAASANPKIHIFVSEWNLDHLDMRTGLYAGTMLIMFERTPLITMASPALFLRHLGVTRSWNDALINFNACNWFGGGNYQVIKLFRQCPGVRGLALAGKEPGISADATRSAHGRRIYLKWVNTNPQACRVFVALHGPFVAATAHLRLVAPRSLTTTNSIAHPHRIGIRRGTVITQPDGYLFTLPPYSAATLSLQAKR